MEAWVPWKEGNPAHIHNLHKRRPIRGSWTWGKSAAKPRALEQGAHRPVLTIPGLTSLPSMGSFCSRKENAKLKSLCHPQPQKLCCEPPSLKELGVQGRVTLEGWERFVVGEESGSVPDTWQVEKYVFSEFGTKYGNDFAQFPEAGGFVRLGIFLENLFEEKIEGISNRTPW